MERRIGEILERFIEDPLERFEPRELAGSWRLQVRETLQAVTCRAEEREGRRFWQFRLDAFPQVGLWLELEDGPAGPFRGWALGLSSAGFTGEKVATAMTLSADGAGLSGRLPLPGGGRVGFTLLRPVHVQGHQALRAELAALLARRAGLLGGREGGR